MALVKHTFEAEDCADDSLGGQERWVADLASDDSAMRRRAAHALSRISDAVPVVCAHLANERSLSVRSVILTGLIINRSPAVVAGLLPLLRSEDANLRNGAIEALQQMPDEVAPYMDGMLADADPDVRIFAINVLAALPHPMVPTWLCRVVKSDPHVNVCAAAVDALAESGNPEAIQSLEELRDRFSEVAFIRFAVDVAIRRIGHR